MPSNILAIGMSPYPLLIYISTGKQVISYTVEKEPKTFIVAKIGDVDNIRFQQDLLILCSKSTIAGFKFSEDKQGGQLTSNITWDRQFYFVGLGEERFIDAILVQQTKLVLLSITDNLLEWQIHDYDELRAAYLSSPRRHTFEADRNWELIHDDLYLEVLDVSDKGLCLIASPESNIWQI